MAPRKGLLSGNALKLIAALSMVADHVGLMFFPGVPLLRLIGRLAFPIFAFMIAEGCRYTRNRLRYFLQIFLLAAACQLVYFLVDRSLYMSILVTFSCSIGVIFALQQVKQSEGSRKALWGLVFVSAVAAVYVLNLIFEIDYGFWGCMVPVFAALFQGRGKPQHKLDIMPVHVAMTALGLLILGLDLGGNQLWALAAVALLLLYSGKRGKYSMKYFFYIFYPLHLALLQLISWLL